MTTYHLEADNFWDVWEFSILEHSLDVFSDLREACRAFDCLCFLVAFLQLAEW